MKRSGAWLTGLVVLFALRAAPAAAAVETVAPEGLEALLRSQAGLLVVSLTSTDPKCQPCMGANARFQMLALGKAVGVGGLPVFLTYQDGEPIRRHDGITSVDVLRQKLLEGAR